MSKRSPYGAKRPAVFLLRDGVLFEHGGEPIPGVDDGLWSLTQSEAPIFVLTSRRSAPSDGAQSATATATACLRSAGITETLIADEHTDERLRPGKALTQTLQRLARLHRLDLASSVLLCDTWAGADAALAAGCQPMLVMTGHGHEQMMLPQHVTSRSQVWYAADLAMAALSVRSHLEMLRGEASPVQDLAHETARQHMQTLS